MAYEVLHNCMFLDSIVIDLEEDAYILGGGGGWGSSNCAYKVLHNCLSLMLLIFSKMLILGEEEKSRNCLTALMLFMFFVGINLLWLALLIGKALQGYFLLL